MTEFVATGSLLEPHVVEGSGDTTMVLNMGPQHPSTHGVLRLVLEIDGEAVVSLAPDIGYLHTGIEKTCEAKFYQQVVPLTDRIDYLCPMTNNLAYCLGVEKLLGLEIPERAIYLRVLLQELTRIAVQTKTGRFSRLILDVGGSRDARAGELAVLVDKAISRIEDGAESASLPPMSSYERKLVHDVVAERGYVSESEGEGRDRHTVITRAR